MTNMLTSERIPESVLWKGNMTAKLAIHIMFPTQKKPTVEPHQVLFESLISLLPEQNLLIVPSHNSLTTGRKMWKVSTGPLATHGTEKVMSYKIHSHEKHFFVDGL